MTSGKRLCMYVHIQPPHIIIRILYIASPCAELSVDDSTKCAC